MAEVSSQIEKLDKNNYQSWKFRIRNFLMGKNIWGVVSGSEVKPTPAGTAPTPREMRAINTWIEKGRMLMFILSQNISNAIIGNV